MMSRLFSESEVSEFCRRALLDEVYTTPKPGLVDLADNGAHTDMDVTTFEKSSDAIAPFLGRMYSEGLFWQGSLHELFTRIRTLGIEAEKAMFSATGGVNTHKGIIFTLGILAASTGVVLAADRQQGLTRANPKEIIDKIFQTSRDMTHDALEADFAAMKARKPVTHGEKLFALYGSRGIRGEAGQGFPIIADVAFPRLLTFAKTAKDENERNLLVLLHIIVSLEDTNVLSRSSPETLLWLKERASSIAGKKSQLSADDIEELKKLNKECIARNVSPGGAADILAASLFLLSIQSAIIAL